MKLFDARWLQAHSILLRLCFAGAAALLLAACGTVAPVGSQGDGKADVMTASDEPETRRRASIRLELAVSYFSEGKTTFALDELKQALVIDPTYAQAYNLRGGLAAWRQENLPLTRS